MSFLPFSFFFWGIMGILVLFLSTCGQPTSKVPPRPHHIFPSFYHWKTTFEDKPSELDALRQTQAKRVYVRLFDLDRDRSNTQVRPVAPTSIQCHLPDSVEFVPVVFITNQTWEGLSSAETDTLAVRVSQKIHTMLRQIAIQNGISAAKEWQFDSDWTGTTKQTYFHFLEKIQQLPENRHLHLSATIRLHQIKYSAKTGVPPVKRGMLMFYNMDNVKGRDTRNSILDLQVAADYLDKVPEYSLPLDLALPLFAWGVVFRKGIFEGIVGGLREEDLNTIPCRAIRPDLYQLTESASVSGIPLQKGDVVRLESANAELCLQGLELLRPKIANDTLYLALYHLDEEILRHTSTPELLRIFEAWR